MAEENGGLSLGNILSFLNPSTAGASLGTAIVGAATGNASDLQGVQDPSFQQRLGSVTSHSLPLLAIGDLTEKATNAPVVGAPLKFFLDFGNRTADSFFGAAAYSDYAASQDNGDYDLSDWVTGWRKSWDSWGTKEHLTAGQLIGGELASRFSGQGGIADGNNPFTEQGAAQIDAMSKKTWYGNIAGGVSDLAAGFISPVGPGAAVVKGARGLGDLSTLARVESAEEVFNTASKAGKLDDLSKQTGRSFFRSMVDAPASGESYAARLRDLARDTLAHAKDNTSAMSYLAPRMEGATEAAKRVMAETAVYAQRLGPEAGTHVIGNAWLAVMGSSKAADEVTGLAPLIMDKIARATAAPEIFDDVARANQALLEAHRAGGDYRLSKIMDDTFETPKKKSVADALHAEVERAVLDAEQSVGFRQRMMSLKPQFRVKENGQFKDTSFDTARLRESRANAIDQHKALSDELTQLKADLAVAKREAPGLDQMAKGAQRDLSKTNLDSRRGGDGTAKQAKTRQDAVDAFGPGNQSDFYSREAGAAKQRVTDLQARVDELSARVTQAKADRDLLHQTPLNDPDAMAKWQADIAGARAGSKQAIAKRDLLAAQERIMKRQLKADAQRAREMAPTLTATNNWLKDVYALGNTGDAAVLNIRPTLLDKAKTAYRDYVGRTYMFDNGEYTPRTFFHVQPKEWTANIGTAYGRSAVNTREIYKGQQELGMYLKKSGVFSGDEIRNAVNEFIGASDNTRATVVKKYNDLQVERMLLKAGIDPAHARQIAGDMGQAQSEVRSYLTGRLKEADANGQQWVRTNEFPGQEASEAMHMLDSAYLRSHLSDTVTFADPHQVQRLIADIKGGKFRIGEAASMAGGAIDQFNYYWKMFNLLRPGLFFRNMLDTGIRAGMLMGATNTFLSVMNGSRHLVRNTGVKVGHWALDASPKASGSALQRIAARQGAEGVTKRILGDRGVKVDVGDGSTANLSLYDIQGGFATAQSVAALRIAASQGQSLSEGLMGSATGLQNRLVKNLQAWDKYKANDLRWPSAYKDHAQALLSSPTAKRMIEQHLTPGDGVSITGPERVKHLFDDPKVRDEYNKLANELDMTREQFIEQLDWEMENMFPEPGMAQAVLSGKLQGKAGDQWVESHFPLDQRFDIPGYESILPHTRTPGQRAVDVMAKMRDESFRLLMDEPDFWLVRHPVMVDAYTKQVKTEAGRLLAARQAKFGDDATLSAKDLATIDARSKTHAVSTVKKYMYDATHSTAFSQSIHRWAPFYNPWFDAMRAYSKLVYDNPGRLQTLAGLWNTPGNLSQWLPTPLVVDRDGNALRTGDEPADGQRYFVLSSLIGGKKPFGVDLKLRQSSFNTILMGNTPWLPGWGPTVAIPMAAALNSNEDVALWLSSSDNAGVKTLMESLWPDGQVPRDDTLLQSILPPTWRKIADAMGGGETYWRNVQYGMNAAYIQSQQDGTPFNERQAFAQAEQAAKNAGIIASISQGVFGLSAQSDVAGQFYANQMHAIQAIPIEELQKQGYPSAQAAFMAKFPEAANLQWTFSRNETGINATVKAQSEAMRLRSLIEDTPDIGWMIVGAENIGGDFSQTAYNQQREDLYGPTQSGRKKLDSDEVMRQTLAGAGWDQYLKFTQQVERIAAQDGYDPKVVSQLKSQFADQLGQQNPTWFADYNTREDKLTAFYNNADRIAKDPRMAGREDIGMYAEYRSAMQEVMGLMGVKSLAGTGQRSAMARAILRNVGEQLAAQNLGFQQMWERMLSKDVETRATDARFGYEFTAGEPS